MIGVNHYPSLTAMHADRSDLLWIDKPQGSAPITTCPLAQTFLHGIFKNLRNQDGSQAFTPVPAIQDDASTSGWVLTSSDVECPDICGTGTKGGLDAARRAELLEALAAHELPRRGRRGHVRWAAPGVKVLVDAHGSPSGPVRDAIVRGFDVT